MAANIGLRQRKWIVRRTDSGLKRLPRVCSGMTLLELLVAIVVFAIMAGVAYAGLNAMVAASQRIDEERARLHQLQFAISRLERDLGQLLLRPIRDEYGALRPALEVSPGFLEMTRNGWPNPLGQRRPEIQRLSYQQVDGKLLRRHWLVPDRTQSTPVRQIVLFQDLGRFSVEVLDQAGKIHNYWPPAVVSQTAGSQARANALILKLELPGIGKIRRLVPVP